MKKLTLVVFCLLSLTSVLSQNLSWDGSSGVGTKTSDYNTSIQMAQIGWGGHHGILFNAYRATPLVDGPLSTTGNTKHSFDVGPYSSGAGAIMYLGNGGRMDFLISGNSVGANQNVEWGVPKFTITRTGVGVNSDNPDARLVVTGLSSEGIISKFIAGSSSNSAVHVKNDLAFFNIGVAGSGTTSGYGYLWGSSGNVMIGSDGNPTLVVNGMSNGNVGIGTTAPDAKLTVKGNIHTQEVRVDLFGAVTPDYVFEKDYKLLSLSEVESYINQNKHLPEVPSAKEMEDNGLNLKEMNLLLLKKVEELTLHLIKQNKKIENQQLQIEQLNKKRGERN